MGDLLLAKACCETCVSRVRLLTRVAAAPSSLAAARLPRPARYGPSARPDTLAAKEEAASRVADLHRAAAGAGGDATEPDPTLW